MKNNHEKTVSTKIKNSIFYFLLFILPKNFISLLVGKILSVAWPKSINLFLLRNFIKIFSINSNEAEKNIEDYESIQEFFCRRLGEGTRKISQKSNVVISPCDGVVSEFGLIENGRLLQVKGKYYQLSELLGCPKRAAHFEGGHFCTIYLSPRDYHRFHVPIDGCIRETIYIPGTLWPVNRWAVKNIKNLFCINERIISLFEEQQRAKSLACVAVGATMVGKIKLQYCSLESNSKQKLTSIKHEGENQVRVNKGQELGRFMFGSTIVLLFEKGLISGFEHSSGNIKMGEVLARLAENLE